MVRGDYKIIDAHAHLIENLSGFGRKGELRGIGRGMARWIDGIEIKIIPDGWGDRSFTPKTLVDVMDKHGVSKAVLMQGMYYGLCNDYTREATEKFPERLAGMGSFDPFIYEAESVMRQLIENFGFIGFKFEISRGYGFMGFHPDLRFDLEIMGKIWKFTEEKQLIISLDMGTFGEPSLQAKILKKIAEKHRGITFVVEHLFSPGRNHSEDLKEKLELLKSCQNISFTTASIPASFMPEEYPYHSAVRYIRTACDIVGSDRIIWGSDLPSVAVVNTYAELIDYLRDSGEFSSDELRKIYYDNASNIYFGNN